MSWTAPRTWVAAEVVAASTMNTHVRDDLLALKAGEFVTALPGSPTNGDRVAFTDSLSAPTYVWHLFYVAAATTYKWYSLGGGTALSAEVANSESRGPAAYGALTTPGPSVITPLAGDYYVSQEGTLLWGNGGGANYDCYQSYTIGGTAAADADGIYFPSGQGTTGHAGASRTKLKTALAAATALVSHYKTGGGSLGLGTWNNRVLAIRPFRVN